MTQKICKLDNDRVNKIEKSLGTRDVVEIRSKKKRISTRVLKDPSIHDCTGLAGACVENNNRCAKVFFVPIARSQLVLLWGILVEFACRCREFGVLKQCLKINGGQMVARWVELQRKIFCSI
jgi:hypothetical protein